MGMRQSLSSLNDHIPFRQCQQRKGVLDTTSAKVNPSLSCQRSKNIQELQTTFSNCMKVQWSRLFTFAGNLALLQFCSQRERSLNSAAKDRISFFLSIYIRLRTTWLFDLIELHFSLDQFPAAPSLQISLKTQVRVSSLPLMSFFDDIYGNGPYIKRQRIIKWHSRERQEYLVSVAKRLLLQAFYSGYASPSDVDAKGQTLIHVMFQLEVQ